MNVFRQEYERCAREIVTLAVVTPPLKVEDESKIEEYYLARRAAWDTGANFTVITPQIVQALGLTPTGRGGVQGIGGGGETETYRIHLGLPCGELIHDLNVYCWDMEDYDILIGMDVISMMDYLITNKDNTVFSFRYPSEGGVELKEQREEKQC